MNDSSISQDLNTDQPRDDDTFYPYVRPILFLTLIFGLNFLSRIILAPLMPTIENDLGIRHGEAGALFLLISAGYFATLLGSGFFSWKLTHRTNIVLSSTTLGLALLGVSMSSSLWGWRRGSIFPLESPP